jgi:hypothetical protein
MDGGTRMEDEPSLSRRFNALMYMGMKFSQALWPGEPGKL